MSRKKKRSEANKASAAALPAKSADAAPAKGPANLKGAKRMAFLAYMLCGLMLGFITGVNRIPPVPKELASPVAQSAFAGDVLGSQPLDVGEGVRSGVLGLTLGGSIGYSLGLEPARMLGGWLLGTLGLFSGLSLGAGLLPAAGGWIIGFGAAVRAVPGGTESA